MDKFFNLAQTDPYQFLIIFIIIGLALGLIVRYFQNFVEFILSFRIVQFAVVACLAVFVIKGLV